MGAGVTVGTGGAVRFQCIRCTDGGCTVALLGEVAHAILSPADGTRDERAAMAIFLGTRGDAAGLTVCGIPVAAGSVAAHPIHAIAEIWTISRAGAGLTYGGPGDCASIDPKCVDCRI